MLSETAATGWLTGFEREAKLLFAGVRSSAQLVFSLVAARAGSRSNLKLYLRYGGLLPVPQCVESICRLPLQGWDRRGTASCSCAAQ